MTGKIEELFFFFFPATSPSPDCTQTHYAFCRRAPTKAHSKPRWTLLSCYSPYQDSPHQWKWCWRVECRYLPLWTVWAKDLTKAVCQVSIAGENLKGRCAFPCFPWDQLQWLMTIEPWARVSTELKMQLGTCQSRDEKQCLQPPTDKIKI